MHIKFKIFAFILIFSCFACNKTDSPDFIKTTGKVISQKRLLNNFSEIELYHNIHLNLVKDTEEFAIITAGKNLLPKITCEITGQALILKNKNNFNFLRNYKDSIIVELHYNYINHLKYFGSGNIKTIDAINTDEFAFESWYGSGHSEFKLNTRVCSFGYHTGIVDLKVIGNTQETRLYATEQGIIDCKNLNSEKTLCHNRGIANLYVNASSEIGVEIYGEGNIYYNGNASISYQYQSSKGKLIKTAF